MTMGREVVEDYRSQGLSLRGHPVGFLRERLQEIGYQPCRSVQTAANGKRISIAGLVLVRQMPGSAKGVMFITLEDEGANANLIVWPTVFDQNRKAILAATLIGCRGRVQNANGVTHVIIEHVSGLSDELKRVSGLDGAFPIGSGRGDEGKTGESGVDSREAKAPTTRPRDMYVPDLHMDTLKVKARNFR